MVSLAVATLLDLGVTDPRRHLFLASVGQASRPSIVSRSPLSDERLGALRDAAAALRLSRSCSSPRRAGRLAAARRASSRRRDRAALEPATAASYLDLTPPTDARPFFFNQLRLDRLFEPGRLRAIRTAPGVFGGNLVATLTLAMLILISAVLVRATIVVPLRSTVRRTPAGRWRVARHRLFRADRHRLHDDRDRPAAAHERVPRPSGLCAQRRPVQPDPVDRPRQPRLGAHRRSTSRRRLVAWSALVTPPTSSRCRSGCRRCCCSSRAPACWCGPASPCWCWRRPGFLMGFGFPDRHAAGLARSTPGRRPGSGASTAPPAFSPPASP